ncbi:MAG: DUF853 family protein [Acidimicrobiaceae bacterium]|nr:DUF853 family protein [Acidimicrobiaceae bacterium]
MKNDPSFLGSVENVAGSEVSVALDDSTVSGLLFVNGQPYHVAQVGSFVRVPLGLIDLIGLVSQAGATPEHLSTDTVDGRMWMTVQLVGHGSADKGFSRGISLLPSVGDSVHIMTDSDLEVVYGVRTSLKRIRVGHVASALSIPALLEINSLVTRHSAIVGTTGAGKSTTVARILESLTDASRYPSARVIVFDIHGEYASALQDQARIFRVGGDETSRSEPLHVPYWALSFEELVELTFGDLPDDASRGAIRDMIVELKRSALETYTREGVEPADVTVDTPTPFSIHQMWFDLHREVNATHTVSGTGQSRATEALQMTDDGTPLEAGDAIRVIPPRYRAATQAKGDDKVFLSGSPLNIRRQVDALGSRLKDRRYDFLFRPGAFMPAIDGKVECDLDSFLQSWIGNRKTVSILDLSGVPTAILTDLIGALTRVIYDALQWSRRLSEGGRERPLLFVFEEAHTYLGSTQPKAVQTAVQRVVKEGRKYGIGAMVVSQRPSEVDPTILSQCGTIVALRLSNAKDRSHVTSAASDNLAGVLSLLPVLRTGEAIVVGEAVPLPMRVLVELPRYRPESADPTVVGDEQPGGWDRKQEESADYEDVMIRWRSQDASSRNTVIDNGSASGARGENER